MKHLVTQPHIIFSVENSPYPDKVANPISHENAIANLKKLNPNNVIELQGHYGKPERSIMISNPTDAQLKLARGLAISTGQESHIESDGLSHKMVFNHGDMKGQILEGRGTQFHNEMPKDMFSRLPDGTTFTHNFGIDDTKKSETLQSLNKGSSPVDWLDDEMPAESSELKVKNKIVQPNKDIRFSTKSKFDSQSGTLHTPKGSFKLSIPSLKDQDYHRILQSSDIQDLHSNAMKNWFKLHDIHQSGQELPKEIAAHAALFSILSANTPVPQQELMYSRLVDTTGALNLTPGTKEFSDAFHHGGKAREKWKESDSPTEFPQHSREYWSGRAKPAITQKEYSEQTGRQAGEISALGSVDAFSDRISKYTPEFHNYLTGLTQKFKGDTRGIVSQMMADKSNPKLPKDHPMKQGVGLGSKTSRYAASMMGGGTAVIPDTHFVRHIFGLDSQTDTKTIDYLKQTLWNPKNHHILNSIDEYYNKRHPAVKYVTNRYFGGKDTPQSNFPAFWLHWLTIAPHEEAQGIGKPFGAKNLTDHTPFFDKANEILERHGINKIKKSETNDKTSNAAKASLELYRTFNPAFASMIYYGHIVPHLLGESQVIQKSELLKTENTKRKPLWYHGGYHFMETSHPKTPADHKAYSLHHKETGAQELIFARSPEEVGKFINQINQKSKSVAKKSEPQAPQQKESNAILHSHKYKDHELSDSNYDEFGYAIKKPENLKKAEDLEPLEKAKKDMMPMFGATPEKHHHEFADWASKALPNKDWQIWAARNYKKTPEAFTPEVKEKLEHFGGSTHMPEVSKVRFDKTHDINTGVSIFEEAENAYNKRIGQKLNVVKPDAGTKKVLDVGNGMAWYSIARGGCAAEGKAMGHCGNVPSQKPGDRILSLRTEHKGAKGEVFHEPHATFIVNNGYLGEMKGRGNTKPDARYHHAVAALLQHPKIKGVVGGGYLHHQNFNIEDLKPEHKEKVLAQKPNISVYDLDEAPDDLPEKFEREVKPILEFKKQVKEKHGEKWREGMIGEIAAGNAPSMALNTIKDPTDDELHQIIASPTAGTDTKVQAAMIGKDSSRLHMALAQHSPNSINYLNNPNIDAIINSKNPEAIENLAENQSLKPKDINKIASHPDFSSFSDRTRASVAGHEHLDAMHHEKLASDKDSVVRRAIADSPKLHPDLQTRLASDQDDKVRRAIAENTNLHPGLHEKLTNDENNEIRSIIAKNPNLHPDLQTKLANDEDEQVRQAVVDNPNLHSSLHEKFASDPSHHIRQSVAEKPDLHPDLHQKLAADENSEIRRAIAKNPSLPSSLHSKLARDKSSDVREAMASNPNVHSKLHSKFANDKDATVRRAISDNPNYKPDYNPEEKLEGYVTPLQNHMNRLKEQNPKEHEAAQDRLVDRALRSGSLNPVGFLINSGVLDDKRHAKLHDELDTINSGDHEEYGNQSWDDNDYREMLYDKLENNKLPSSYHDEFFKRIENSGHDVDDIADHHFENNRDSFSDSAYERADEIARDNYPMSEYLDDLEREMGRDRSGKHILDQHIENSRSGMPKLKEELQNRAMERLKTENKIDEDGNYSDLDLDDAVAEEKDQMHEDLRAHLDGEHNKLPQQLHQELDRYQNDLYDRYDESVRDGYGWNEGYDQAMRELKNEFSEDPGNWPSHLAQTSWVKENIKPSSKNTSSSGDHGVFDEKEDEEEKLAASEKPSIWDMTKKKFSYLGIELSKLFKSEPNSAPVVSINPEHGRTIANAYDQMKHDPSHPKVKAAYAALIDETKKQFKDLLSQGYRFSAMAPKQDNPYKNSKEVHHDIENNKHLWFFSTEHGFGSEGEAPKDHPMLAPTEFTHNGKPLLANDLFRIVHDINGHYKGGKSSFGAKGEQQAYLTHKKQFSPLAQKALATETMGQNNWVNWSASHGESNRKNPAQTRFADQKAGLLPDNIINGRWHE